MATSVKAKYLLQLYLSNVISLEDYAAHMDVLKWRKWHTRQRFSLDNFSGLKCREILRFSKAELYHLTTALRLPGQCRTKPGHIFTELEGLCILLARLSTPAKLMYHVDTFHRDRSALSRIFHWMLDFIAENFKFTISSLTRPWQTENHLIHFSECCSAAGSPLPNIVGFIDGTARVICRPSRRQQEQYSGHKCHHAIKYQAITFPNGIVGRLDGPFNGRRHDAIMLKESHVLNEIAANWVMEDGSYYRLFGDKGYTRSKFIAAPHKGVITDAQEQFNNRLGQLRVHVEYGFGKVINLFPFTDYVKQNKLLLQPVQKTYLVATILTNCHSCLYGNQTATFFQCRPMTLESYLSFQ